ncbi:MAG: hypothetical protein Q9225_002795 [Loekoesia sp. 1 TL-2023]
MPTKTREGYREGLDLVLRDQNQIAKASAERRQKEQVRGRIQSPEISSGSASPDTLTVYSPLPESQDFYAHTFFVSAYIMAPRDPRAEHGFLGLLPLLFDKLSSNIVLSQSLAAVAHSFFGAWEPAIRNAEQVTVQKNYIKALGALRQALRDPQECVSDEILMAVCLLGFFEDTLSVMMSRKRAEDHVKGATALIKQRRSLTMTSELSKRLLIAARHSIVRYPGQTDCAPLIRVQVSNALATSMYVPEASEIWQDPEQMPYNPATLLDAMRVPVANLLAAVAEHASPGQRESLSDEARFEILPRAKAVYASFESWPSLVPQDWWPIHLYRRLIPQQIIDAGLHGDHCDLYPHTSVCETWLVWRTSRVRILSLIADLDQSDSKHDVLLQIQQTADDILASVPFMLGSKSDPAAIYDTEFVYPCLPGETVSVGHYHCAAAFGGLTLWLPLRILLANVRHLRDDQIQFSVQQVRRLARLYDIRMLNQDNSIAMAK